ncbi:hypothetical protein AB0C40_25020 [Streptomyces brevispora]|uniref:hypothetical protein n=1 Tax=Streptomyces brevispora TaxID=887462 RepID=UPI0033FC7675
MTTVARTATTPAVAAVAVADADGTRSRSVQPVQPVRLPSVHMRVLLTWIAVFTALTAVQSAIGPYLAGFPMLLRTLVITGIVVPAVVHALVPHLLKVRAAVLRRRC